MTCEECTGHGGVGAEIAKALVKFASMKIPIHNDAKNPAFKSDYATIGAVLAAVRGPLAECGLAATQWCGGGDGYAEVTTVLVHESGQTMEGTAYARIDKPGPHALMALYTYLRRGSLNACLGLASEDDDGNSATGGDRPAKAAGGTGLAVAKKELIAHVEKLRDAYESTLSSRDFIVAAAKDFAPNGLRSTDEVLGLRRAIDVGEYDLGTGERIPK